jgi:hypothetical protein
MIPMESAQDQVTATMERKAALFGLYSWVGRSVFVLMAGVAAGLTAYGVAYLTDKRTTMEKLADTMADTLSRVTFKLDDAKGVVTVDPRPIRLDTTGSIVRLDTDGAKVRLDPTQRLTEQQLKTDRDSKVVTEYTVFKSMKLSGGWQIDTGWKYRSSQDTEPFYQYCYMLRANREEHTSQRFDLADNGVAGPVPTGMPLDFKQVTANCVWFDGQPTRNGAE